MCNENQTKEQLRRRVEERIQSSSASLQILGRHAASAAFVLSSFWDAFRLSPRRAKQTDGGTD